MVSRISFLFCLFAGPFNGRSQDMGDTTINGKCHMICQYIHSSGGENITVYIECANYKDLTGPVVAVYATGVLNHNRRIGRGVSCSK